MSIKKNFIYSLSYQILIMILPLITTPYIARVIGPEGIGIQSYTMAIANYFVLFSMLGISNHGNRSIAISRDNKEKMSKVFLSIYSLQVVMSFLMIIIYCFYITFFIDNYKIFFAIQLFYIISALLDVSWFFFGIEEFKVTVIRNTIIKFISVISIFIFVNDSNDIYIYSLILALGNLISQIILWFFLKSYIKFTKITFKDITENIKPVLVLFIPVVSISIYKIMDKVMLGNMSSMNELAFFENSEKIVNIPMGVIVALSVVMLPKMSNLQAKGNDLQSRRYILLSIEFVMFIGIGAMFGLIGVSPILIPIFLDFKFIDCIEVVSLLSITIVFISWANVIRTQFLIPKKKDKVYIVSTIIGAIVNLFINLLLINKLGAIGAAIGTIFAEASVAIYQTIKVRKELDILKYISRTIFYVIPGIIMCITIRYIGELLGQSISTGVIQIIIGGSIYLLISFIYMIIIKNEIVINFICKLKRE